MSLKHFHIFFIFFVVFTGLLFAAFALLVNGLPAGFAAMGWLSLVGSLALAAYGVRFIRKARKVIV